MWDDIGNIPSALTGITEEGINEWNNKLSAADLPDACAEFEGGFVTLNEVTAQVIENKDAIADTITNDDIDTELSVSSKNPVQNKIITKELNKKITCYNISDFLQTDGYYRLPFKVGDYFILKNDTVEDVSKLLYGYNESWYSPSVWYSFSDTIKAGETVLCYMKATVVDAGDIDGHGGNVAVYKLNEEFAQIKSLQQQIETQNTTIASHDEIITTLSNELDEINNTPELMSTLEELNAAIEENGDIITALDAAIDNKADVGHTHTKSEITDFPTSLKNPNALTLTVNGTAIAYDGSSAVSKSLNTPVYATCSTAASTTAKAATTTGDFTLTAGATVHVSFTYSNSASAPTLNVNGTGAIAIKQYGTTAPQTYSWYAGSVVEFVYNGTYWIMTGKEAASTTYAGIVKLSSSTASTSTTTAATSSAVKAAYDLANTANTAAVAAQETADTKKRTATLVIGTSTAGYTASDVDYLCDGTDDQTEINAAISALPEGGGKIVLLEGTYNISSQITVNKDNVTIEGMGTSTVLERTGTGTYAIYISTGCTHPIIREIKIVNEYSEGYSITIRGGSQNVNDSYAIIENCYITGGACGIEAAWGLRHITIRNNTISNVSVYGISLNYYVHQGKITGNHIVDCSGYGIYLYYSNYNSIQSNMCYGDMSTGIYTQGDFNTVADNMVYCSATDSGEAIYIHSNKSLVMGNVSKSLWTSNCLSVTTTARSV